MCWCNKQNNILSMDSSKCIWIDQHKYCGGNIDRAKWKYRVCITGDCLNIMVPTYRQKYHHNKDMLSFRYRGDLYNRHVSHMRAPLVACGEQVGRLRQLCNVLHVFEHKTQYILTHASFTRIVVFWLIGNVLPNDFVESKIVVIPPRFVYQQYFRNIAIKPAVGCYNSWANLGCSSCSPLGEIFLWNGTIRKTVLVSYFDRAQDISIIIWLIQLLNQSFYILWCQTLY